MGGQIPDKVEQADPLRPKTRWLQFSGRTTTGPVDRVTL